MKIETAIKQLNKEQAFLGLGLLELLEDITKVGAMVYSEKTMEAYRVFMNEGSKLFAEPTVNETLRNRSTYFGNDI
jgi:hypothetical protein